MVKTVILAKRPDLVLLLEKYRLLPPCKQAGAYRGCAKKWAKEGIPPYDEPVYQAMAERLPAGWEELTIEEIHVLLERVRKAANERKKVKQNPRDLMQQHLTEVAWIAIATVSALIVDLGLGMLPDNDKEKDPKHFTFDLVAHLINGSDLFTILFKNIARTMHTSENNQGLIADILKWAAMMMAILTASRGDKDRLKALIISLNKPIQRGVATIESFVSEGLAKEILQGDKAERIALSLQQARIALNKDDFDGLYEAYRDALSLWDITPDHVFNDLDKMHLFAQTLRQAYVGTDDEMKKITIMSQAL